MAAGQGIDAQGGPVIDPTANVIALVEAGMKRQDDLREMEARHVREVAQLRADHERELRLAEAARLDAIRRVDVEATATAAEAIRATVEATAKVTAQAIGDLQRAQYEQQGQRAGAVDSTADQRSTVADRRSTTTVALLVAGLVVTSLLSIAAIAAQAFS